MTESENDFYSFVENIGDTNPEIECQIVSESNEESGIVSKIISNAILHALDALLSAILTPFIIWQWLSKHEHVMIMLKVIIEVSLELMMWTIFAFASILTTAALLFDDWYKSQESQKIKNYKKNDDSPIKIIGEGQNLETKFNQDKKFGKDPIDFYRRIR